MRLQVKGRNLEVSAAIRDYAERKLGRLEKQLSDGTVVELELSTEKNPSIADGHLAEATIFAKGANLRAHERAKEMKAAIDQLVDNLERQLERYRSKRRRRPAHKTSRGPE
jgi:putative sigma-54 modulation protein